MSSPGPAGNRVERAARAALIFTGRSAGRVDRTTCRDVRFGIVVSPDALPLLGRNDCSVARTR